MALFDKNETTYDKSTAVRKYTGPKLNMAKLIRKDLGNGRYQYRTANGTVVSDSSGKLTKNAWNYLASKYGKDYANRTSANMMRGHIWQNGRWNPNGKVKDINAFNRMFQTAGNKQLIYNGTKGKVESEKDKSEWDNEDTVIGNLLKMGSNAFGLKMNDTAKMVGGLGAYFIPGVGTALSAADAVDSLRKGNFGEAALNAAFALPVIGGFGKALKAGTKLIKGANKVARTTTPYRTGIKLQKFAKSKPIKYVQTAAGVGMLAHQAPQLYNLGKAKAKQAYYGDDLDNYSQKERIDDMRNVFATNEEKENFDREIQNEMVNGMFSNNQFGYGYET